MPPSARRKDILTIVAPQGDVMRNALRHLTGHSRHGGLQEVANNSRGLELGLLLRGCPRLFYPYRLQLLWMGSRADLPGWWTLRSLEVVGL